MKKKLKYASLLLGALLAMPGAAFAATYTAGDITTKEINSSSSTVGNFGVVLDFSSKIGTWDGSQYESLTTSGTAGKGSTYRLGNITSPINSNVSDDFSGAVLAGDYTGKFTFGDVTTFGGKDVGSYGIYFQGTKNEVFSGTLTAGNINASLVDDGDGYIMALAFKSSDGSATTYSGINGNVTVGNIAAAGRKADVTGMVMGSISKDKTVKVGNVNVIGQHLATGVLFSNNSDGSNGNAGSGSLFTGDVYAETVEGGGFAYGLRANGKMAVNATVGAVTAKSASSNAIAIGVDGKGFTQLSNNTLSNLTLTDDVTATSGTGAAYGISAASVDYTAANTGKVIHISGNEKGAGIDTSQHNGAVITRLADGAQVEVDHLKTGSGNSTATGKGIMRVNALTTTGGIALEEEAAVIFNYDGLTDGSKIKDNGLVIDEGSKLTVNSNESSASDIVTTMESALDTAKSKGLIRIQTDAEVVQISGDGTVKSLGVGLSNGFIAAASMHQRYSAWNAVNSHLISGDNRRGYRGQECDPCAPVCDVDPCDPCDSGNSGGFLGSRSSRRRSFGLGKRGARSAWVNYIGRGEEYEANASGEKWKLGMDGVQVGTDLYKTNRNQFGVLFGYEGGSLVNGWNRVETDNLYGGVYGAHVFRNGADLRGSFTYGQQDFTMVRLNLTETGLYRSNFDGTTTETTIELGKRFFRGNWSFRPVFGVDMTTNELEGSQESLLIGQAGGGPYTYGETDFTQVFLRFGTDLRYQLRRLTFNSGLYYSCDVNNDELVAYAQQGANTPIRLVGSDLGRELLTFNVGGEYQLARNFSIFGGYQGQAVLDTDTNAYQSVGYVGGSWKW